MKGLEKLTYELSLTNILSSDPQTSIYTPNDGEYYAHTYMCLFLFSFRFFSCIFFYIYTNAHTLNMNKISPKDDINNG